ncbi:MAG: hypothetical protein BWY83_00970 [bacterium ADurb.Bin478]|nr:MAG: hypothetical protein BWY83_00970 [bacterium ADurb.Bin478]
MKGKVGYDKCYRSSLESSVGVQPDWDRSLAQRGILDHHLQQSPAAGRGRLGRSSGSAGERNGLWPLLCHGRRPSPAGNPCHPRRRWRTQPPDQKAAAESHPRAARHKGRTGLRDHHARDQRPQSDRGRRRLAHRRCLRTVLALGPLARVQGVAGHSNKAGTRSADTGQSGLGPARQQR